MTAGDARRDDVEFPGHDGTRLRGWWYAPQRAEDCAVVVMAHGFSAVKEMVLDRYAEVFAAAGLGVLVYDHRNFGASDGEPRQEIDPWGQVRDYRAAIRFASAQPGVDGERLGIWGSSFSGGEVLIVAACDERVRAVAANVPLAGLPGVEYADTRERFEAIRERVQRPPRAAEAPAPVLGPFAVVDEPESELPAYLPQPESREWFLRLGRFPGSRWQNRVTLRNAFVGEPPFDPGLCIDHVAPTPLLMVVAEDDRVADAATALAAFERAGEPKRLATIPGHHFAPYAGPPFRRAAKAARDFFLEFL